jgi:nucleotide-binding universal stress UspA family protein
MYRKVLVPMALDHGLSAQTLKIAQALAGETGEIIALHVYEEPNGSVAAYLDAGVVEEGYARAKAQLTQKLTGMDAVKGEIIKGHTYRTIIDYAATNAIECIVIGSHKPGLSDYLLGSTAARVVRHAPCAVHVHRSS